MRLPKAWACSERIAPDAPDHRRHHPCYSLPSSRGCSSHDATRNCLAPSIKHSRRPNRLRRPWNRRLNHPTRRATARTATAAGGTAGRTSATARRTAADRPGRRNISHMNRPANFRATPATASRPTRFTHPACAIRSKRRPRIPTAKSIGHGGGSGPAGSQCDVANYSYPWRDNFCEKRSWDTSICPSAKGHQGQDIRPATCKKGIHWAVAAEAGQITNIGSYTVTLTADSGIRYRYLHMKMDALAVALGDTVTRGQHLGFVVERFRRRRHDDPPSFRNQDDGGASQRHQPNPLRPALHLACRFLQAPAERNAVRNAIRVRSHWL